MRHNSKTIRIYTCMYVHTDLDEIETNDEENVRDLGLYIKASVIDVRRSNITEFSYFIN